VEARAHTIEELHDALQTIWEDLGISPDEDSELAKFAKPRSDVLTLERIADYERLIAEAQVLRVRTSQPFLPQGSLLCSALLCSCLTRPPTQRQRVDKVNALVVKLIDLWSLLEAAPADDFDEAVLAGNIGHSNEVLMTLDARYAPPHQVFYTVTVGRRVRFMGNSHHRDTGLPIASTLRLEKLLIEKEKRESKIRDYGTKINKLWDKLMVPTDEREEFFERSTQTLGPSAIRSVRRTALPHHCHDEIILRADTPLSVQEGA
jgi:hypothetical protein